MGCTSSAGLDYQLDAPPNVEQNINKTGVDSSSKVPFPPTKDPLAHLDLKAAPESEHEPAPESAPEYVPESARRKVKKFIKPPDHLVSSSCSEESELEEVEISVKHANTSLLSTSSGEGVGGENSGGERLTYDEEFWRFHNLTASGKMR